MTLPSCPRASRDASRERRRTRAARRTRTRDVGNFLLVRVEEMMTTRAFDGLGYAAEEIARGGGAGGETLARGFVCGGAGGDGGEGIWIAEEP